MGYGQALTSFDHGMSFVTCKMEFCMLQTLFYVFLELQYPGYSGKSSAVREIYVRLQMMQERHQQRRTLHDITSQFNTCVAQSIIEYNAQQTLPLRHRILPGHRASPLNRE